MAYVPTKWRDHIVDPTQSEKDKDGNIIIDEYTGKPKPKVIQEGTRFAAQRMNNIEDGIVGVHSGIDRLKSENDRLKIEIEMLGRVKENNGTFFDPLDGESAKALTILTESAIVQLAISAGETTIKLDKVPFKVGEVLTIFDDEKQEDVTVTSVSESDITVADLVNSYKKGAGVVRSNSVLSNKKLSVGNWGSYSVDITEVV
ncbi:hypothetical protein SporoP37_00520 [Sporosarcina sp. P37]|uniref:hypothetical protein n=1 Tax=unclassified Sporosarcina TaxID=2647733 RepID=UPI000A17C960|nr:MULTISPECIES: hypothetical protein [unclassified Sporosarcina]ARK23321.1 hypothetical protein SporoP37_00520 [Sporosarcina sp. P37]PID19574.1 hypothetical protein CSV62_03475 [Sporosarcina sp. P35]